LLYVYGGIAVEFNIIALYIFMPGMSN
jgi:hypothetical protein